MGMRTLLLSLVLFLLPAALSAEEFFMSSGDGITWYIAIREDRFLLTEFHFNGSRNLFPGKVIVREGTLLFVADDPHISCLRLSGQGYVRRVQEDCEYLVEMSRISDFEKAAEETDWFLQSMYYFHRIERIPEEEFPQP